MIKPAEIILPSSIWKMVWLLFLKKKYLGSNVTRKNISQCLKILRSILIGCFRGLETSFTLEKSKTRIGAICYRLKYNFNLLWHPSWFDSNIFQYPSLHWSHRVPSALLLHKQRPMSVELVEATVSHSPPPIEPAGSQSHAGKRRKHEYEVLLDLIFH